MEQTLIEAVAATLRKQRDAGNGPIDQARAVLDLLQRDHFPAPNRMISTPDGGCVMEMIRHLDEGADGYDLRMVAVAHGFEAASSYFRDINDNEDLSDRYEDGDETVVGDWHPLAPADGYILAAKFDTEDGPVAWFIRPLMMEPTPEAARRRRSARAMLAAEILRHERQYGRLPLTPTKFALPAWQPMETAPTAWIGEPVTIDMGGRRITFRHGQDICVRATLNGAVVTAFVYLAQQAGFAGGEEPHWWNTTTEEPLGWTPAQWRELTDDEQITLDALGTETEPAPASLEKASVAVMGQWDADGRLTLFPPYYSGLDGARRVFLALMAEGSHATTEADVLGWTDEQRRQAAEWVLSVHYDASDNPNVIVPPRPDFLPAGRVDLAPGPAGIMNVTRVAEG